MPPQVPRKRTRTVASLILSAGFAGSTALAGPPPAGVDRTPAEVIRDQIFEEGVSQRREAIERERKQLDDIARRTSVTLDRSAAPSTCDALRDALYHAQWPRARTIASTSPRAGLLPSTNTVGAVVALWVDHCRLTSSDALRLLDAFGIEVPKAAAPPMPFPDLPAAAFPAGPPGELPPEVTDVRRIGPAERFFGNLVPSGMSRVDVTIANATDQLPTEIWLAGYGPKDDVQFLRSLFYTSGQLSRIVDTYYCWDRRESRNTPCQEATFAYRDGRVKTIGITRGGKVTQPDIPILPSALPAYVAGRVLVPDNHAPPGAIISFAPPSDRIPPFSAVPDLAELQTALTLPQRRFKETLSPHFVEGGQIRRLGHVGQKLLDPKRRRIEGGDAVVFERFIDFQDNAPVSIRDTYYCDLPAPPAKTRFVAPCGAVVYAYSAGVLLSVTPERRPEWAREAGDELARYLPNPSTPTGAMALGASPPASRASLPYRLANASGLAPTGLPAGAHLTTDDYAFGVTWTVFAGKGQPTRLFERRALNVAFDAQDRPLFTIVEDHYFCRGKPCGAARYTYGVDGKLVGPVWSPGLGKPASDADLTVAPKKALVVASPPPDVAALSDAGALTMAGIERLVTPILSQAVGLVAVDKHPNGDSMTVTLTLGKSRLLLRWVSLDQRPDGRVRLKLVRDVYACGKASAATPCGSVLWTYDETGRRGTAVFEP